MEIGSYISPAVAACSIALNIYSLIFFVTSVHRYREMTTCESGCSN
jgi:hypothetical protein